VLRPIAEAAFDTTEAAIAPDLATLEASFLRRLDAAREEANRRLEAELEKMERVEFVRVALELRGRELSTEAHLAALLREIEDRLRVEIAQGRRVRLT
jgi:hypothetical protein